MRAVSHLLAGSILITLLISTGAAPAIGTPKHLRVGGDDNLPVSSVAKDGKAQGLFPEIFQEIASLEGWQYEYVPCVRNQCMEDLAKGKLDVLLATAYSPKRAEEMDFSNEFLLSNWGQVYVGRNKKIESILDLENKRIAMVSNNIHSIAFRKLLEGFGKHAIFIEVDKMDDVFSGLAHGDYDAGVVNRLYGQAHEESYNVDPTTIVFNPIEIKFAVPKGKNADVLAALDRHIAEFKQQPNSIYARSYGHWVSFGTSHRILPQWFWPAIYVMFFIFIGLTTGITYLRYQIRRKTAALVQAKEDAELSRRLYSATLDNTSQFQGLLSPDGTVLNINQTSLKVIGQEKESVIGMPFWKTSWWAHDQIEQNRLIDAITRCAEGELIRFETTHQDTDGNLLFIDFSLKPVRDNDGSIIYLIPEGRDISDQKKMRDALQQSEQELQSLFLATPVGIAYVKDRVFQKVNDAMCDLYGYSREELIGQSSRMLYATNVEYEEAGRHSYHQAMEINSVMVETHTITKQGDKIDILMGIAPLVQGDETAGFVTVVLDITDRNKVIAALKESEERFQTIFNESPMVIALNDLSNGGYVDVNRKFCEIRNNSRESFLGKTSVESGFISEEENLRLQNIFMEKGEIDQEEISFVDLQGNASFFLLYSKIVEITGKPHSISMLQDITARKNAEIALADSEKRFRTVIEKAPIGISMVRDMRYIFSNTAHAQIFGFDDPLEIIGKSVVDMIAPQSQQMIVKHSQQLSSKDIASAQFETIGVRKDGTEFPYLVSATHLDLADGPVSISFGTDISERKHALDLMIESEKMSMVAGMAAGMAHEVNNPLGIIAQDVQNMERRLSTTLAANLRTAEELGLDLNLMAHYLEQRGIYNFITSMHAAVKRASVIISNMLKFSRQNSANKQLININDILEQSIKLASNDYDLRKKYDFKNITLLRNFYSNLPAVEINTTEIEQVFINLLKNAAQAMFDSGTINPTVTISTSHNYHDIIITITDNGPGMSESVRKKIFDPFFTTKDVGSGTGLGLSVSHTIITKNHGGALTVESQIDHGACFTIRLPLVKESI